VAPKLVYHPRPCLDLLGELLLIRQLERPAWTSWTA
jgi:hypothetical protein